MIGPDRRVHGLSDVGGAGDQPVSALRGAHVEVNAKRVVRVLVAACVIGLVIVSVVLFVGGANTNAKINELHQRGVPVTVTISGCLGLLGGSGSNAASYVCRGNFTVDGHHYNESIPGNVLRDPGTKLQATVVPDNVGLISPTQILDNEHASSRVFIVPTILLALLVVMLLAGALFAKWRKGKAVF